MFIKITKLFQKTFPQPLDEGVLAPRPPAVEMELSTPYLGGWLEKINRYALEASRQKNAYLVDDEGFLMYDALMRVRIMDQFHQIGIDVTRWQVNAILLNANGVNNPCTQIATECYEIQTKNQQKQELTQ